MPEPGQPRIGPHLPRRSLFGMVAGGSLTALLQGCAMPDRETPVPAAHSTEATVLGIPNERFYPSNGVAALEQEFIAAVERMRSSGFIADGASLPEIQMLAVSGGGENGAFGAGLLCGWTAQGSRPVFELVTGVSTGALIAPFAYLGPRYDAQLRSVYTELSPDEVLRSRYFGAAIFDDAMADNSPLFRTISRYVNEAMMADIARAYESGRLLLIGTTNLDAQLPVIWNVGAIARSGHPRALDTVRRIMLASAAIPGAFPPSMIDVTLDGKPHQEMHVDGGAFAQAFLYPAAVMQSRRARMLRKQPVLPAVAYVIRNGRLDPEWAAVERRTLGIASRAISTMIAASGYNDVTRIYANTLRDGIDFNLAFIGTDFNEQLPSPFDTKFMRDLFEYGYAKALHGYAWAKQPPF